MKEIHIRNLTEENERKSIMNTPMIDHAENIDFTIIGADEEMAEMEIKKLYDLI